MSRGRFYSSSVHGCFVSSHTPWHWVVKMLLLVDTALWVCHAPSISPQPFHPCHLEGMQEKKGRGVS